MKKRGFGEEDLAATERSIARPPPDHERATLLGRERARDVFNQMIARLGGQISISGERTTSWKQATAATSPEWREPVIRTLITMYIATRKPRKSKSIHQSTLNLFVRSLLGAYEQDKGIPMGLEARAICSEKPEIWEQNIRFVEIRSQK